MLWIYQAAMERSQFVCCWIIRVVDELKYIEAADGLTAYSAWVFLHWKDQLATYSCSQAYLIPKTNATIMAAIAFSQHAKQLTLSTSHTYSYGYIPATDSSHSTILFLHGFPHPATTGAAR